MSCRVRRLSSCVALAVLGALAAPLSASPAAAAATSEIYARPSNGVFTLAGHGYGHGHGMSQWGANGAASKKGLTGAQIAAFYYPNTAQAVLKDSPIRVMLDCQTSLAVCGSASGSHPTWPAAVLSSATGLTLVDRGVSGFAPKALPTDRNRWRVRVDSAGYHLDGRVGATWSAYPSASTVYKGPLELTPVATGSSTPLVRMHYTESTGIAWREYRGAIRVVRSTTSAVRIVNLVPMESYLLGVVPHEATPSWPLQALFAQAIAARSYSAYSRGHAGSQVWDICDTNWCQVYFGTFQAKRSADGTITRTAMEYGTTNKAVRCSAVYYPKPADPAATPDPCSAYSGPIIRTYSGQPIFAEFATANGGWSTKTDSPDTTVQKYLIAQQDPYDGLVASSAHSWSDNATASTLEHAYLTDSQGRVGHLTRLRITGRDGNGDWGGRVTAAVVDGTTASGAVTSVSVRGSSLKSVLGLRSDWFKPTTPATPPPPPAPTVSGAATSGRAQALTISGTTPVGTKSVSVLRLNKGDTTWSSSTLTPDSAGKWSVVWHPTVDVSYYAAVGSTHTATRTTTVTGTTIWGPATATTNTNVVARGYAAPNATVTVCWRRLSATTCSAQTVATSSGSGYWASYKTLDVTYSYSASAAGATSPVVTTRVS